MWSGSDLLSGFWMKKEQSYVHGHENRYSLFAIHTYINIEYRSQHWTNDVLYTEHKMHIAIFYVFSIVLSTIQTYVALIRIKSLEGLLSKELDCT